MLAASDPNAVWASTGVHNWNHIVIDAGTFVTNTVEQYTLEIVDNYGGGPWVSAK